MPFKWKTVKNFCHVCKKEFDARVIGSTVQKTCSECLLKEKIAKYARSHCQICGRSILRNRRTDKPICSFCEENQRKANKDFREIREKSRCRKCRQPTQKNTLEKYHGMCIDCFLSETGFSNTDSYRNYIKRLKEKPQA